jgi:hypothetical protein
VKTLFLTPKNCVVLIDPVLAIRFLYAVKLRVFMSVVKEILTDPVRSPIFKHERGGLVLRWVTTGESPLLYVFVLPIVWEEERRKEEGWW